MCVQVCVCSSQSECVCFSAFMLMSLSVSVCVNVFLLSSVVVSLSSVFISYKHTKNTDFTMCCFHVDTVWSVKLHRCARAHFTQHSEINLVPRSPMSRSLNLVFSGLIATAGSVQSREDEVQLL